jgi:hypothetical protein
MEEQYLRLMIEAQGPGMPITKYVVGSCGLAHVETLARDEHGGRRAEMDLVHRALLGPRCSEATQAAGAASP